MTTLKNLEYVMDARGRRNKILIKYTDFERMQEEIEDLEDALDLEKARQNATGFKKWNDFIKECVC